MEAAEDLGAEPQPSSTPQGHLSGPEEPAEAARSGGGAAGMVETERDRLIRLVRSWLCASMMLFEVWGLGAWDGVVGVLVSG